MRKTSFMRLIAALLALGWAGATSPAGASMISFDPDGGGGLPSMQITGFDFAPGNVLVRNALPLTPGTEFQLYYQATLTSLLGPNGPIVTPGLNGNPGANPFQITVVASVTERVVSATAPGPGQPASATFQVSPNQNNSFFQIYFNNALTANNLTGTGFNDGTLILSGTPTSSQASSGGFTFSTQNGGTSPVFDVLDKINPANYPGIQTVVGSGSAALGAVVTSTNSAFFTESLPIISSSFGTNDKTPFDTIEPSRRFLGMPGPSPGNQPSIIPNIGQINGISGPDFQFQADGFASFQTPEPAAMTLMGTGLLVALLGRGWVHRRRVA